MDAEPIIYPLTGEVLPDDPAVLAAALDRVEAYLRRQRTHYRFRDELRRRVSDLRGPVPLPRPLYRSERQQRVAECPSCGRRPDEHEKKEAAA